MRTAPSISELGPGVVDGELAVIPLDDDIKLKWDEPLGEWHQFATPTFRLHSVPMIHFGPAGQWKYLFLADGNAGSFNRSDFGWNPFQIRNAAAAYAAGLHFQEKLSGLLKGDGLKLGTVMYPFKNGSKLSGLIDPDPYVSVQMESTNPVVWSTTRWTDSALTEELIDGAPVLAPHLYTYSEDGSGGILYDLHARIRLIGTP